MRLWPTLVTVLVIAARSVPAQPVSPATLEFQSVDRTYGFFEEAAAFTPSDAQVLVGATLFDMATGRVLRQLGTKLPLAVAVSADSERALLGGGVTGTMGGSTGNAGLEDYNWSPTADVLDAASGRRTVRFYAGEDAYAAPSMPSRALNPDGSRVAAGSGTNEYAHYYGVFVVRAADGVLEHVLEGHTADVVELAFSPDGRRLLSGSADGTARLWDARTGAALRTMGGQVGGVVAVAFSPDGALTLTAAADGVIRLWRMDSRRADVREVARFASFNDGGWAVVDPDGRFDTNRLDGNAGLHGVAPDDPFTPLPLQALARDQYEPGLLARLLADQAEPDGVSPNPR